MELLTPKAVRRSTRIRVEIPLTVTSLDRLRPFAEKCVALIVSCQGCGFRSSRGLQLETPIILSDLPGGGSVTARVASCVPFGSDGGSFLVGAALYTHENVWGIPNPPADWNCTPESEVDSAHASADENSAPKSGSTKTTGGASWPYNIFSDKTEAHPGRK